MKGSLVALGQIGHRPAAARLIDGQIEDLRIDPPEEAGFMPEAILRGTVGRPIKGMGGVFVDLPGGGSGFLKQVKGLRPGQSVLVQVAGVSEAGKATPISTRLLFKGRTAILTPDAPGLNIARTIRDDAVRVRLDSLAQEAMAGADPALGLILRSAAEHAPSEDIAEEIADLRRLCAQILADASGPPELLLAAPTAHEIAARDWSLPQPDTIAEGADAFERHGILEHIDTLTASLVALPGGGSMHVEPTRALIAIDVNTGRDTSPAAGLKANLAAARDLPRQLRLRGLGGQVVIDFAPMAKRDRQVLEQALRAAFRREGGEAALAGWTVLGNFELQRKRDRLALAELLGPNATDTRSGTR